MNQILDLNDRINKIHEKIQENAYSTFSYNEDLYKDLSFVTFMPNIETNKNFYIKSCNFYVRDKSYCNQHVDQRINQYTDQIECPICYENITPINIIKLKCNHILCRHCSNNWNFKCKIDKKNFSCPLCRNI